MSGDEGYLTLAIRMRVSPNPLERMTIQMRGTCESLKESFLF